MTTGVPAGEISTSLGTPVTVVRELRHVSPEDVWQALEDPAALARWWSPGGTAVSSAQVELCPGGTLRVLSRGRGLIYEALGTVVSAERPWTFRTTWQWVRADPGLATGGSGEVTVTVESVTGADAGSATRVTVRHDGLEGDRRERNAEGWGRASKASRSISARDDPRGPRGERGGRPDPQPRAGSCAASDRTRGRQSAPPEHFPFATSTSIKRGLSS